MYWGITWFFPWMRNEFTTSRLCNAKCLYKASRSHRQQVSDLGRSPLRCRNHRCNEEPSGATSLEICNSLRIAWDIPFQTSGLLCWLHMISAKQIDSFLHQLLVC
jgi:hypothetical protein